MKIKARKVKEIDEMVMNKIPKMFFSCVNIYKSNARGPQLGGMHPGMIEKIRILHNKNDLSRIFRLMQVRQYQFA